MNLGPSPAELDALTAWWLAHRHIGRAATLLGRSRQTIANTLLTFRRLEGATDNVDLALKYLDEIERRKAGVLGRTSHSYSFGAVASRSVTAERAYRDTDTAHSQMTHNFRVWGIRRHTGTFDSAPPAVVSTRLRHRMAATESGKVLAGRVADAETAEAVGLHALDLGHGEHRVGYQPIVTEHRVVIPARHGGIVLPVAA